jgi:hypothetical protein
VGRLQCVWRPAILRLWQATARIRRHCRIARTADEWTPQRAGSWGFVLDARPAVHKDQVRLNGVARPEPLSRSVRLRDGSCRCFQEATRRRHERWCVEREKNDCAAAEIAKISNVQSSEAMASRQTPRSAITGSS